MTKLQQFKGSQTCEILEKSTIYTVIWAKLSFYTCKMTEVNLFLNLNMCLKRIVLLKKKNEGKNDDTRLPRYDLRLLKILPFLERFQCYCAGYIQATLTKSKRRLSLRLNF